MKQSRGFALFCTLLVFAAYDPWGAFAGQAEYEFRGVVEALPASGNVGDWTVSGVRVRVTASTSIDEERGTVAVGATVEVKGTRRGDGSVDATRIKVEDGPGDDGELRGTIERLPDSGFVGDWLVSGRTVHVASGTSVDQEHGIAAVGAFVEVHGTVRPDMSIDATRVEVNPSDGTPTGGHASFYGTVESMPSSGVVGNWVVSGHAVRVSASTAIEQEHGVAPAPGVYVQVEGTQLSDGAIEAVKIEVESGPMSGEGGFIEYRGRVDSLPPTGLVGEWVVGGRTVFVDASTEIKQKQGRVRVRSLVEVYGNQRPGGSIDASRIEVKADTTANTRYVRFYGTVEQVPSSGLAGEWLVGDWTVHVAMAAIVDQEHGAASAGAYAEVVGNRRPDGTIDATRIEIKVGTGAGGTSGYIEFQGTVESLPASGIAGDWVVSGRTVHVPSGVRLREKGGPVGLGVRVEVEGNQRADQSVDATKIDTKSTESVMP
jgi:hypothetical protein